MPERAKTFFAQKRPMKKQTASIRPTRHRGRSAHRIANDKIEMHWLTGGGHLANFATLEAGPAANLNLVWASPWETMEPQKYNAKKHATKYGGGCTSMALASYTGHVLCLDYFGMPSAAEEAAGLPLHAEAGNRRWSVAKKSVKNGEIKFVTRGTAPSAGMAITREILLRENESVAVVRETVANKTKRDRYFQWVQHATFGPPFLKENESIVVVPGTQSKTAPATYGEKTGLAIDREFTYPHAPTNTGTLDLSQPFVHKGKGFNAAVLLGSGELNEEENKNQTRPGEAAAGTTGEFTYVAVLNWRLGVLAGYVFRRADFPWISIWEENHAREESPWNGATQARGLEFGNTPFPLGLHHAIMNGPLFNTPTVGYLPAHAKQTIPYALFTTAVPKTWRKISRITVTKSSASEASAHSAIVITGPTQADRIELPASVLDQVWPTTQV
jgi:hypothetical protein